MQENQQIRPLVAASQNLPKTLTITVGSTICEEQVCRFLNEPYQAQFLTYGSSSLKAGLVAEGKADCYIRLGDTGEWDTAVAEVLLREVGGKFLISTSNHLPIISGKLGSILILLWLVQTLYQSKRFFHLNNPFHLSILCYSHSPSFLHKKN